MALRRIIVAIAGGIAVVLGIASTAWACFVAGTAPSLTTSRTQASPGARVTVTGGNWVAGADPVALRWGSAGGAVLTQGFPNPDTRGAFSVLVTVPDESAGPHMIYAVQPGSETQAVVVDITSPASGTVAPTDPGGEAQPTRTSLSTSSSGAARVRAPEASPVEATVDAPAVAAPSGLPAPPATGTAAPSPAGARVPAPAFLAGRTPARGASTVSSPLLPSAPATPGDDTQPAAAVPSLRSAASDDLWSGLASGLDSSSAPSLLHLSGGAAGSSGTSEALIGLGLLVSGAVALSAGFAAAELRRRKAMVSAAG